MKEVELAADVQQHRRRKDRATVQLVAVLSNAISPLAEVQRLLSQQGLQEQNFCCTVKFLGFLMVTGADTVLERVARAYAHIDTVLE
jgi:hypothetical protein